MTPPLVLVPGLGLDARSSARLRRLVPARVVELPGMGLRGAVPPLEELAGRLLGRLAAGPVVLVGHSQSCQSKHPVPLTARELAASLWTGPRPPIRGCARCAAWRRGGCAPPCTSP